MRKIREEVDEVLGDEPIRLDHIAKLKYTSGTYTNGILAAMTNTVYFN